MGTEAVALTVLGAAASRLAVRALLGPDAGPLPRPGIGRIAVVAATALVLGLVAAAGWLLGVVGWVFCFAATGLLGPALVTDLRHHRPRHPRPGTPGRATLGRPGAAGGNGTAALVPARAASALGHGLILVFRSGLRPGGIRLVNYAAWLLVRLALGWGVISTLGRVVHLRSEFWLAALAMLAFALANTVAYAAAGCLDAVLYLESRIRLEALDINVRAARRRGDPTLDALVIPVRGTATGWASTPPAPGSPGIAVAIGPPGWLPAGVPRPAGYPVGTPMIGHPVGAPPIPGHPSGAPPAPGYPVGGQPAVVRPAVPR
jgi:hypothetical protein